MEGTHSFDFSFGAWTLFILLRRPQPISGHGFLKKPYIAPLVSASLLTPLSAFSSSRLGIYFSHHCSVFHITTMTEYDYSPEAFEKYMERQTSVARWVDRQAQESHKYRNPLVPDEYAPSASPSRSNSGGSGGGGGRGANLPRSVSTPPEPRHQHSHTQVYAPAYGYGQQNQVYGHRSGHSSHRSHTSNHSASTATLVQPQPHRYNSSSSHSHSRSHSTSHTAVYSSNGGGGSRHPPARSRTYATAMASMSATHLPQAKPTRSQTLPSHVQPQFTGAPGQTVVMHNGRQTYVVVPPHGARVQVCVSAMSCSD